MVLGEFPFYIQYLSISFLVGFLVNKVQKMTPRFSFSSFFLCNKNTIFSRHWFINETDN